MRLMVASVLSFAMVSSAATAANIRGEQQGSTFLIWVTNTEDRSVNCSGSVTATYSQFGQPGSSKQNINGGAPAKTNNHLLYRWTTTWAASTLSFSHSVQCS